ncbi:MAG: ribose 5-phosphate isomerase A, partial [Nitrospira sp. LK265]|nr:ribose 5-phosphate isomerase A [Nitrospira sp. LK265]
IPFKTEAGHLIVDVHIDRIDRPGELEAALSLIPGVVETGLFVGRTNVLIVGTPQGVHTLHVPRK